VHIRILQRVFSFPVVLAGLLVVLSVLTARSHFDDPDMWWHLKTGEVVWTTHAIPVADLFSYTTNHQTSIPQEWLSQVAIYGAYKCGGFSGLMLLLCFLDAALLVAGYGLCRLYSGNAKVAFVGAMIIWFFATVGLSMRPQMIGYLLLIAELALIQLGRTRNPRWFFCLPILFALWVNCHGSFILGIVLGGVFLFSSLFRFQWGSLISQNWDSHRRLMLALALILSVAALFLNPVGIRQIMYPINTMLHQPLGLGNVEEWAPLRLSDPRGVGLFVVLLCSFLLVVARRAELFLDELLLLALGTWLGGSHSRMIFVFGILAAPVLSRQLSASWDSYEVEQDRIWPNAVVLGMSMLVAFVAFPSRQNLEAQLEAQSPVKAVEFIKTNHLSGPMLNDYEFGGYLIWAAPEHPVFVDGRSDIYEWSGLLAEFENWANLQSDPNVLLQKYKVNFCLLTPNSPMVRVLPLLHEWKMVFSDNNAVIFVRTASESGTG